jgi:hypothetical protein
MSPCWEAGILLAHNHDPAANRWCSTRALSDRVSSVRLAAFGAKSRMIASFRICAEVPGFTGSECSVRSCVHP